MSTERTVGEELEGSANLQPGWGWGDYAGGGPPQSGESVLFALSARAVFSVARIIVFPECRGVPISQSAHNHVQLQFSVTGEL